MLDEYIKEPFSGFDKQSLVFLKKLKNKKNNNKLWFDKNRDTYVKNLKEPMQILINNLASELFKIDSKIIANNKSIFRINRDVRFSNDKTPYKSWYAAAFAFDTIKKSDIPQFYFHFSSDEFIIAGGQYSMDPDKLKKIRSSIFNNFELLKKIISNRKFVLEYNKIQGDKLTKLPKGFENANDKILIELLKMKQYYVSKTYKPEIILKPNLVNVIIDNIKLMYSFTKFLNDSLI